MPRAKRLVLKLGSAVLSGGKARLDAAVLRRVAGEVAELRSQGTEVVIVSSGAILAGAERLKLASRPSTQLKQAAAAIGQSRLMRAWELAFARHRTIVAQVLLTREDLRHRERYLNARNTLLSLLRLKAVPVINENDTVAVEEIKFGDNDVLSALVAGLCGADLLVLLTDQEGLFSDNPRTNPAAVLIPRVEGRSSAETRGKGAWGSGGMDSKVRAGTMAAEMGIAAVIASGLKAGILPLLAAGEECGTLFAPRQRPLDKRQQWLAFAAHPKGQIHVDGGAKLALTEKFKSLLPSGVKSVSKSFAAGDAVSLVCEGAEFARGLSNYGAEDLAKIKGLKTSEIEAALGHKPADEVVHRDNLVILGQ